MKKIFALLLAAVMLLSLAACAPAEEPNVTKPQGESKPTEPDEGNEGNNAEIPTEEGKVTYYFTMSDDSVALADHTAVYITGGAFGWCKEADSVAMQNLEGTNIWYVISDKIPDPASEDEQKFDFQLVVGYTQNSGVAEWGLKWVDSYKSVECAEVEYSYNPKFEYVEGQQTINLGTHTFSAQPPVPVKVSVTLVATFAEALPEGTRVLMMGGLNDWSVIEGKTEMTSEDGKVWTLEMNDILANDYEFKLLVIPADADYDGTNHWDVGVQFGVPNDKGEQENASVTIMDIDDGGEVDLFFNELVYEG